MKRILALALTSVMIISSSVTAFATEPNNQNTVEDGSESITAELVRRINELQETIDRQEAAIEELTKAVKAKQTIIVNNGGGGGGGRSSAPRASSSSDGGNYVNFGGTITYQGGKIEINGGRSNVTFTIKAPSGGTVTSANTLAAKVGGSLVSCIETSSPGVGFNAAKVNFFVGGVQAGDNITVYQAQNGSWVQLPVVEIRKDHVVVNMTRHGTLAFVRVQAMATITQ